ncbi:MAG: hypothetical protein OES13_03385 [Acidimicrobiia bacterium]|nr:hypothetical protein [Acidimicrobiia bacterium]
MNIVWGIVIVVFSLLAWGGQAISFWKPETAARLTLTETEEAVEPTFWADIRAEALWDTFTLWTLLAAGGLLIADAAAWPYFGLVGGGIYLYFAGRGVLARLEMRRRGLRVGTPASVRAAYFFLPMLGAVGAVTIAIAAIELSS